MKRIFVLSFLLFAPVAAMAQGSVCSEQTIQAAIQNNTTKQADDSFFWSGAFDKPLIGKAERDEARKKAEAEAPRKNQSGAMRPQRIEVSKSGDMAYEYGSGDLSFDDVKSGKHFAFEVGYLRVWKSASGECKVAATMIMPIKSTYKSN